MAELLHAGALAASGVGACCVALSDRGPRIRELALAVVMMLAMLDITLGAGALPVVAWSALIVAFSMLLAVRRQGAVEAAGVSRMRVFSSLGGILMAVLMLTMSVRPDVVAHHGVSGTVITQVLVVASVCYAAAAVVALRRTVHRTGRLQLVSMSGSILLLAVGHLAG